MSILESLKRLSGRGTPGRRGPPTCAIGTIHSAISPQQVTPRQMQALL